MSEQILSGFKTSCLAFKCYCVLGAVPMVGRHLCLSVPWSLKTTLRKEGRPMGPATPRAFDSSVCYLFLVGVGSLGMIFGSCIGLLGNQIRVSSCRPSDLSPCFLGCLLLFFSLSCSFSFFRRAGEGIVTTTCSGGLT